MYVYASYIVDRKLRSILCIQAQKSTYKDYSKRINTILVQNSQ